MIYNDKIAQFEEKINAQADAEIEALLAEAKVRAEKAIIGADEEYLEKSYHVVSGRTKDMKRRLDHEVSQKSFEATREIFAHRNQLVEDFFDGVAKRVLDYVKTDDYRNNLADILKEVNASRPFTPRSKAYVRAEDVDAVKKLYPSLQVEADKKIKLGGVTVYYPEDKIYIDRTFDNTFAEQKTAFADTDFMRL